MCVTYNHSLLKVHSIFFHAALASPLRPNQLHLEPDRVSAGISRGDGSLPEEESPC